MFIEICLQLVAWVLIWAACDIGRKKESKIKPFSQNWFLQYLLLVTGSLLMYFAIKS